MNEKQIQVNAEGDAPVYMVLSIKELRSLLKRAQELSREDCGKVLGRSCVVVNSKVSLREDLRGADGSYQVSSADMHVL
jgi:hypothetical protein